MECAGLGLSSLESKNPALLAKWWWRFGKERESFGGALATKYGVDKWGWWPNLGAKHHVSGLWRAIASLWDVSIVSGKVLSKGVGFMVGYGRDVRFWLDDWVGGKPFL